VFKQLRGLWAAIPQISDVDGFSPDRGLILARETGRRKVQPVLSASNHKITLRPYVFFQHSPSLARALHKWVADTGTLPRDWAMAFEG